MNQIVTKCEDCPMFASHYDGLGGAHCNHPETEGYDLDTDNDKTIPDWCPLKKEDITITIKNKQL